MDFTNYFTGSIVKSAINSNAEFSTDNMKPELLLDHYKEDLPEGRVDGYLKLFKMWYLQLFHGYNIAVRGPQSKFYLLETFKAKYIDSGRYKDPSRRHRKSLKVTTVRMHGRDPISMEQFENAVFHITGNRQHLTDEEIEVWLEKLRKDKTHYLFLIHSYELFYLHSRLVCTLILDLYEMEPRYIHILIGMDRINGGKIIDRLHYAFIPYDVQGQPYKIEYSTAVNILNQDEEKPEDKTFRGRLDVQSLNDIYQAIPENARLIMKYILNNFIKKKEDGVKPLEEVEVLTSLERRATRSGNGRATRKRGPTSTHLDFDALMKYCMSEFIVRRSQQLRNHLGELVDHRLIEYDESGNRIQCIVDVNTCKRFLAYIETNG